MWLWVAGLWVAAIAASVALARRSHSGPGARQVGAALLGVLSLTLLVCIGPRRGRQQCPTCRFYIPRRASRCMYCTRELPSAEPDGAR